MAADLARGRRPPQGLHSRHRAGDDLPRLAATHNAFAKIGFISSHLTVFPMPNYPDVRAHLLAQTSSGWGGKHGQPARPVAPARSRRHLARVLGGRRRAQGRLRRLALLARGRDDRLVRATLNWSPTGWRPPLLKQPAPRRRGATAAVDPPPDRRGHAPDGYATENGTGLVFFGTELQDAFTEVEGKLAYSLTRMGDTTREEPLATRLL